MRLKDKVIILTGATRGVGYAVAKAFVKEGAKLILGGSTQERAESSLKKLKEELNQSHIDAIAIGVNIGKDEEVKAMIKSVMDKYGKIDVLVNNAGVTSSKMLLDETIDNFQNILDINVVGAYRCIREVTPIMIKQGYGSIINTTSVIGLYGGRSQAAYSSSKFALNGLTKCCAKELGTYNIRVNAVAPGCINTDMLNGFSEKLLNQLSMATPLGRVGDPDDLVGVYVLLASDESKFMTGSIVSVDGGIVF